MWRSAFGEIGGQKTTDAYEDLLSLPTNLELSRPDSRKRKSIEQNEVLFVLYSSVEPSRQMKIRAPYIESCRIRCQFSASAYVRTRT
jgi:hypothetical protein